MTIGAMNHPQQDPIAEIHLFKSLGLEFIDLTLEPPAGASWRVDAKAIRQALEETGMDVVGHTAYYLPIESPFEGVRKAAVEELKTCLRIFAEVGAKWMNVHPGRYTPMHPRSFFVERDIQSLGELIEEGERVGCGVMVENIPGDFNTPDELGELLAPLPDLGLHLDIGHANLSVPYHMTGPILDRWGDRLRHVHLHDNKGGHADLHLALGQGTLDVPSALGAVKRCGYDGPITLEVFSEDDHFLVYSRDRLRDIWNGL